MYMNGVGIQEKTRRLTDVLWDAVPLAIIGTTAAITAPVIFGVTWAAPPSGMPPWWTFVIVTVCVFGGVYLSIPYWRAERALKAHRLAMEAETEQRGSGWASS